MLAPRWLAPAADCEHGARVYASGIDRTGTVWHAWACPDKQCDHEYSTKGTNA